MGRHKNNAIILTSIVGEIGVAGFQGPDGQPCYTGTGNPNNLTFTYPSYLDGLRRETLYYQDTVTGEVWSQQYPPRIGNSAVWVLNTSLNKKGERGAQGATATDKLDINFFKGGSPLSIRSDVNSIPVGTSITEYSLTTIAKVWFQGTDSAPDISEMKVIASVQGSLGNVLVTIEDQDGNNLGAAQVSGQALETYTAALSNLPAAGQILTIKTYVFDYNSTDTQAIETKIAHISIR